MDEQKKEIGATAGTMPAIMVVGDSGAGKSTLMHVLKDIPLVQFKDKGGSKRLTPADPKQMICGSKIGLLQH